MTVPERSEPVLIGPAFAGKTTIGERLAQQLHVRFVDLDEVADAYYRAARQDLATFTSRVNDVGYAEAHRWWQPARVKAVQEVLADYHDCVIAMGAGHTHYEDDHYFSLVSDALAPFANIILLLPSPDLANSVRILRDRARGRTSHGWHRDGQDWLLTWSQSPHNTHLASRIVYTAHRPIGDTVNEIVAELGRR